MIVISMWIRLVIKTISPIMSEGSITYDILNPYILQNSIRIVWHNTYVYHDQHPVHYHYVDCSSNYRKYTRFALPVKVNLSRKISKYKTPFKTHPSALRFTVMTEAFPEKMRIWKKWPLGWVPDQKGSGSLYTVLLEIAKFFFYLYNVKH